MSDELSVMLDENSDSSVIMLTIIHLYVFYGVSTQGLFLLFQVSMFFGAGLNKWTLGLYRPFLV